MTFSRPNLVRLLAADIGLTASVWFVVNYTYVSHLRFKDERAGSSLGDIAEDLVAYSSWLYVLPLIALPIGLWFIFRRPRASATLEILLSATWLLALFLAAFCVLVWQGQYIRVGSLNEMFDQL